jgi:phage-related protein
LTVVASQPSYDPRELTIEGSVVSATRTAMLSNLDELKWRIGNIEKTYTIVDDTSREFRARCTQFRTTGIDPYIVQRGVRVRLKLWLADPRIFATSDTVIGSITTSPVDMPLGTAPSLPSITVVTSGTFTLTYKDSAAATIATLNISGATAPTTIDMDAMTITDGSGNAAEHLVAGSDFPIVFDPEDGDYVTPDWPTLECSSGTATATYRKTYL